MVAWLLVVHVFGWTFWVSGLIVTAIALSRHTQETDAVARKTVARLERAFLRGMADPGALITILAGIALISTNPTYYVHAEWLHIKFIFVAILIILHIVIAIKSKAFGAGRIAVRRSQATILLVAVVLDFLLILICTLPGEVFLT